jgi:hypothetical protein
MDENWLAENEEEGDAVPAAGLGYDEQVWIGGVRISPYDCPDCLRGEEFDCSQCTFFIPQTCRLRSDSFLMQDTRTIFDIYRERRAVQRAAQFECQRKLIRAVRSELQAHGRPLHYAVLARIVADRNPTLEVTEKSVLFVMAHHPNVFERVGEGVYECRKAKKR